MSDVVTVERFIPAPPSKIFDLLADPSRHRDIDGSGTVRDAKAGSERLVLGSQFGMSMRMGIPYSMQSTVIELEEDRRIAWQTRGASILRPGAGWTDLALRARAPGRGHAGAGELGHHTGVPGHQAGRAPGGQDDGQEHGRHPRADRADRHPVTGCGTTVVPASGMPIDCEMPRPPMR